MRAWPVDWCWPLSRLCTELRPPHLEVFDRLQGLFHLQSGHPRRAANRDGMAIDLGDLLRPDHQGPPLAADITPPQVEVGEVRRDPQPNTRATHAPILVEQVFV
jgi:hypothetical protein